MLGYWMFSNRQIFENKVNFISNTFETIRYGHKILERLNCITQATPFLISFIIMVFIFIFPRSIRPSVNLERSKINKLATFKNTTPYFSNLTPDARD